MQATIRIKGYDGIEHLALGKRTAVFAARSRKHKVPVVIKALLPHLAGDRRFLARFERVARAAVGVRHDNLVNVLDLGRTDSTCFIVAERYEGTPLAEILAEHPRVPATIALAIVLRTACALEAVHAGGVIHRDVRPANMVLTDEGGVKLANLGLATDIPENGRVTHAGKVTATPAYMSPEQTRGEELDGTSDIFSLGAVAYELLTGVRAFGKGDFGDIVDRIQAGGPRSLGEVNPVIESAFAKILERMLAADPAQRYPHISEVVMDLEEAIDKYGYACDDGAIAAYIFDPAGFTDQYARSVLERITAKAPPGEGASPAALLRYYAKVAFLDPSDEGAKRELARLRREQPAPARPRADDPGAAKMSALDDSAAVRFGRLDPSAEYRVILESFDSARDNEASFALKLSMKLRTPLPRIKTLVRGLPSRVSDRLPYKRALHLAKAIEEVGGRVRLDVCPDDNGPRPGPEETRASGADPGKACPSCGHREPEDSDFCSICTHRFNPERLNARILRERGVVEDNPLAEEPTTPSVINHIVGAFMSWPLAARIAVGAVTLLLILQLVLR